MCKNKKNITFSYGDDYMLLSVEWQLWRDCRWPVPLYIHFRPWLLRSLVTSVLGPKCTSISVLI